MATIGFTGTRDGMTTEQYNAVKDSVANALNMLATGEPLRALHGDCVGADADFNEIAKSLDIPRFQRPCNLYRMRALTDAIPVAPPQSPALRNRWIVIDSTFLIACPNGYRRIAKGSGTWMTIGFAEKAGKRIVIVYPDGSVKESPAARSSRGKGG